MKSLSYKKEIIKISIRKFLVSKGQDQTRVKHVKYPTIENNFLNSS